MPVVNYRMTAQENYAAAFVSKFNQGDKLFQHEATYQVSPGATFDYVRRTILYNASCYSEDGSLFPNTGANDTGYVLWSGQNKIAVGGHYKTKKQKNLQICEKNVDSTTVTWNDCYGVTHTVPNGLQLGMAGTLVGGSGYVDGVYLGVALTGGSGTGAFANIEVLGGVVYFIAVVYNPSGGYAAADVLTTANTNLGGAGSGFTFTITGFTATSDGTYRRFVESQGEAQPQLVDPRTGNTWVHVDSVEGSQICTVYLFRQSDSFQQVISPLMPVHRLSHMEPIGISDTWAYVVETSGGAETSAHHLCLTPRAIQAAETACDYLLTYANFDFPTTFNAMSNGPNAFVFTKEQTVYFLKMAVNFSATPATRGYKLYRFDEPSSAPFGGPVVGGGFTDVTPWAVGTGPNTNAASYVYNPDAGQSDWGYPTNNFLYYLSGHNQIAIVSKFFSWQTSNTLVVNPALTFFDLTYYDVAGTTFDYHHAFVTGYMANDWTTLASSTGAAWIVIDAYQINQFPSQNTYTFSGHDYTKVWFAFVVQPYDAAFAAPDNTKQHTIFVEYQLAYGSAPEVLQIVTEGGWDTKYPDYASSIDNENVVWNSQGINNNLAQISNAGLYDAKAKTFWWGGEDNLYDLSTNQFVGARDTAPFLKLQFYEAAQYCFPICIGCTYTSKGQILRPATPQESQTQSGPAMGKLRRMTSAAPLLFGTQGISMGVDFTLMRPLALKSPGGTVSLTLQQTFSGVYWGTVDATDNYDNMWCWQVTRPYPATVVAVECQLETKENL